MRSAWRVWFILLAGAVLLAPGPAEGADEKLQRQFFHAVNANNLADVKAAVAAGADVNAVLQTHKERVLALHYASQYGLAEVVRYLLSVGANPNALDPKGQRALNLAIKSRQLRLVQLLVQKGARVKARDTNHDTALHYAALFAVPDIAALLLKHGAPLEARNKQGETALHMAALRRGLGPTSKDVPLRNDPAVARLLIGKGAKLEVREKADRTPLLLAAADGNVPAARLLLDRGADLRGVDARGANAARISVVEAGGEGLELFLKRGLSHTQKFEKGWDLLHLAAGGDHPLAIRTLLAHGVPVDGLGPDTLTPLGRAAHLGKHAALLVLIEGGAAVSKVEKNAWAKAAAWRGKKQETLLHLAVAQDTPRAIPFLLSLEIPVDAATARGETALHHAAHHDRVEIARRLLAAGAKVDARRKNGDSALILAVDRMSRSVITLLLEQGADPNARGEGGNTALHMTHVLPVDLLFGSVDSDDVRKRIPVKRAIYDELVKAGGDPDLENEDGQTARQLWSHEYLAQIEELLGD